MSPTNETAAPASAEHSTLYVAIEISQKSWVVGVESPASEKIGLHSLGPADKQGLRDLIENQRPKAERALDREVRVLCCYEAGYEDFWLARWLEQEMCRPGLESSRRALAHARHLSEAQHPLTQLGVVLRARANRRSCSPRPLRFTSGIWRDPNIFSCKWDVGLASFASDRAWDNRLDIRGVGAPPDLYD